MLISFFSLSTFERIPTINEILSSLFARTRRKNSLRYLSPIPGISGSPPCYGENETRPFEGGGGGDGSGLRALPTPPLVSVTMVTRIIVGMTSRDAILAARRCGRLYRGVWGVGGGGVAKKSMRCAVYNIGISKIVSCREGREGMTPGSVAGRPVRLSLLLYLLSSLSFRHYFFKQRQKYFVLLNCENKTSYNLTYLQKIY